MRISVATRAAITEKLCEQVNAMRDSFEQSPITLPDGTTWDYDTKARERIPRSIAQWDNLGDIKREDGRIPWTLADNSVRWVLREELEAAQASLDAVLASRGARLHAHAALLKAQAPFLPGHWDDPSSWPL